MATYGFEIWHTNERRDVADIDGELLPAGWYYWVLPDGSPSGPHATSDDALIAVKAEITELNSYTPDAF